MTHIDKINVKIQTRNVSNAGTNGEVYLGIGGREFRLDQPGDQFGKGDQDDFTIGIGSNIENPNINDLPLNPGVGAGDSIEIKDTLGLGPPTRFPVYIRLDPRDDKDNDWNVESVHVDAIAGLGTGVGTTTTFDFPKPGAVGVHPEGTIWLGRKSGLVLYLEPT